MKLSPAFLLAAAAAAAMVVVAQSQDPCCSTDADCLALQSDEQMVRRGHSRRATRHEKRTKLIQRRASFARFRRDGRYAVGLAVISCLL